MCIRDSTYTEHQRNRLNYVRPWYAGRPLDRYTSREVNSHVKAITVLSDSSGNQPHGKYVLHARARTHVYKNMKLCTICY